MSYEPRRDALPPIREVHAAPNPDPRTRDTLRAIRAPNPNHDPTDPASVLAELSGEFAPKDFRDEVDALSLPVRQLLADGHPSVIAQLAQRFRIAPKIGPVLVRSFIALAQGESMKLGLDSSRPLGGSLVECPAPVEKGPCAPGSIVVRDQETGAEATLRVGLSVRSTTATAPLRLTPHTILAAGPIRGGTLLLGTRAFSIRALAAGDWYSLAVGLHEAIDGCEVTFCPSKAAAEESSALARGECIPLTKEEEPLPFVLRPTALQPASAPPIPPEARDPYRQGNPLADRAQRLEDEWKAVMVENAQLRRKVEDLERQVASLKGGKR